jgi:uncharacterized membrane protein SpoIIM required for sporulation/uncharacterized RDD family membrane protein YckC
MLDVEVATPERIALGLPVAGVGHRCLAYLVDLCALSFFWVSVYFVYSFLESDVLEQVRSLSGFGWVLVTLALFATQWIYWIACELAWQGRTLGKRALRIRVVRLDGSPVGPLESAVRNLARAVDFLPVFYALGLVSMLMTRNHLRLGDLLAGTLLVRDERAGLERYEIAHQAGSVAPLNNQETELVLEFLQRAPALDKQVKERIGRALLARLSHRIPPAALQASQGESEAFLAALLPAAPQAGPLVRFVAEGRASWERLEALLAGLEARRLSLGELEEMDQLYRKTTADLARAQADFAGTDLHRFLNGLCGRAYGAIYQAPPDRLAQLRTFFRQGFPQAVREHRAYVWTSLSLLGLGLMLGALVVVLEPHGAEVLVPEGVRTSIGRGEMWTDSMLSIAPPSVHASWIATNNLSVSLATFASGILGGLGTLFMLLNNGVQIGAICAFCIHQGMGFQAFSFMGAHGPVELTTIVLAGAAGLRVGHALLDPGELSRRTQLAESGREAVKLVLGSAPFLALIGIVEGFISPGDLFPGGAKIALGLLLGVAFWGYLARAGRAGTVAASARRAAR